MGPRQLRHGPSKEGGGIKSSMISTQPEYAASTRAIKHDPRRYAFFQPPPCSYSWGSRSILG